MRFDIGHDDLFMILNDGFMPDNLKRERLEEADIYEILDIIGNEDVSPQLKRGLLDYIIDTYHGSYNDVLRTLIALDDEEQSTMLLTEYISHAVTSINDLKYFVRAADAVHAKLPYVIAKEIHDKYGKKYFKENESRWFYVESYCNVFYMCLTDFEKSVLYKFLLNIGNGKYIRNMIDKIKFSDEQEKKLQSKLILYQLAQ